MVCPSDDSLYQPFYYAGDPTQGALFNSSYGINEFLTCYAPSDQPGIPPIDEAYPVASNGYRKVDWPKVLSAPHSTDTIVSADNISGVLLEPYDPNTILNGDSSYAASNAYPLNYPNQYDWRRHASSKQKYGTLNVLYLDGHCATVNQGKSSGMTDAPNILNDINGLDYVLGPNVTGRAALQTMPY